MKIKFILFFILLFFNLFIFNIYSQNFEKSRSVWVEQGLVKGKIFKIEGKQVQIFRGIPYAEPPIGELRFKKPIKKEKWEKEFSAIDYGPPCLQFMDFHKNDRYSGKNMKLESEDCLTLNIFSPYDSENEGNLNPILVWIYGGSFLAGSADTGIDMEILAKNIVFRNITFISVNYRLGPLGFMSLSHGAAEGGKIIEGNFGLWDINLALEWVQRNIKQFNGDPNRVILMGESAGSAAVSALAVSPLTKELLHGVITMSGSATAGWAIHRLKGVIPQWDMINIADYIRCNKLIADQSERSRVQAADFHAFRSSQRACNLQEHIPDCLNHGGPMTSPELLSCFRNELNFSENPLFWRALAAELGVSKMIVDGELIVDSGIDLIKQAARVPMMTGVARKEWGHKKPSFYHYYRYSNLSRSQVEESVRKIIENAFAETLSHRISNSTIDLISNATFLRYIQDLEINYEMPTVVGRLQDLESDVEFVSPCQNEIDAYVMNGIPVFAYSFDYIPKGSIIEDDRRFYSMFGNSPVGLKRKDQHLKCKLEAFHGLDHSFIFTQGYSSNFHIEPFSRRDKTMSRLLTKMIANFVITGDPSTENFTWPSNTNESMHYVSLDLPPK
ncbi:COesterase domain-containing protein [Meloidogyne graminicola]|uniref:COesterase domain-containing protein n=1 Tax=Meloidogyne graminicola TaxID=189291 RepID=A0A8T0A2Q6_9BILA|nr:COesterase domain-containing protein [Meloidogyne graminicola]